MACLTISSRHVAHSKLPQELDDGNDVLKTKGLATTLGGLRHNAGICPTQFNNPDAHAADLRIILWHLISFSWISKHGEHLVLQVQHCIPACNNKLQAQVSLISLQNDMRISTLRVGQIEDCKAMMKVAGPSSLVRFGILRGSSLHQSCLIQLPQESRSIVCHPLSDLNVEDLLSIQALFNHIE